MTWDSRKHPRDPSGRFRKVGLAPGEYMYRGRGGELKSYWINEMGQMETGSSLLAMAAHGSVYGSVNDDRPLERIHLLSTEDGEQLAVAASDNGTFGVINHDRAAPPEAFSFNRGSKFQPVGDLPEGETSFGGRAAMLSDRPDGKTYDTLNARKAEEINRQAFEHPNAKVYHADPGQFAEAAVQARHYYQDNLGFNENAAREAPVYVYAKRDGTIVVEPVYRRDDFGNITMRRSPNSHGGSGTVKLAGSDVTRMTRAMQDEGMNEVSFTISGGTNLNKDGKPLNNALHFRQEMSNPTSGDNLTVWGTVEQRNHGVEKVRAAASFAGKDGRFDKAAYERYAAGVEAIRDRNSEPYRYPRDRDMAAKLARARTGNRRISADNIAMDPEYDGNFRVDRGDYRAYMNGEGRIYRSVPNTPRGFAREYNKNLPRSKQITAKSVQRLEGGYFRVPDTSSADGWRYYDADGKAAASQGARNGMVYNYGPSGEMVPTGRRASATGSYNIADRY